MGRRTQFALGAVVLVLIALAVVAFTPQGREAAYSIYKQDNGDVAPFEIADGLFYLGSSDIAVYALNTPDGIVLIDAGYGAGAARVLGNMRKVGLDPARVKIILSSHAHFDHAAGFTALRTHMPEALLYAADDERPALESGGRTDFYGSMTYTPVRVDRPLQDGQVITLGGRSLQAHVTPGHAQGCTSWTFQLNIDNAPRDVLLICSLTILPDRFYEEARYPRPQRLADLDNSMRVLSGLRCDVFLSPHVSNFGFAQKRAGGPRAFLDHPNCADFIAEGREALAAARAR